MAPLGPRLGTTLREELTRHGILIGRRGNVRCHTDEPWPEGGSNAVPGPLIELVRAHVLAGGVGSVILTTVLLVAQLRKLCVSRRARALGLDEHGDLRLVLLLSSLLLEELSPEELVVGVGTARLQCDLRLVLLDLRSRQVDVDGLRDVGHLLTRQLGKPRHTHVAANGHNHEHKSQQNNR